MALGTIPSLLGIDPLAFTMFSMAMTVVALPILIAPLLVVMNDEHHLRAYTNGWITNAAVIAIVALAFALAVVAIPLQILGG